MKFFRKVNFGVILLLVVVIATFAYIICKTSEHSKLDKKAEDFIISFFEADKEWRTIPMEYRDDSSGYVSSIEKDVKAFFCEDGAYEYYIKYAILSQYEDNVFIEENEYVYMHSEISKSIYDGKNYEIEIYVDCGFLVGDFRMSLQESVDGMKISFLNYPFALNGGMGNGSDIEAW